MIEEIWDDVGNSSGYLYTANSFYDCCKSCTMAKYNCLAKSSLCGAGAQILFVTLVACQRGTKNIWAFPISFTSSVGKLYIQFMSWHLLGSKVHLPIREEHSKAVLAGLTPFLKKHHFFHKLSQNWERFEVVICRDALLFYNGIILISVMVSSLKPLWISSCCL